MFTSGFANAFVHAGLAHASCIFPINSVFPISCLTLLAFDLCDLREVQRG